LGNVPSVPGFPRPRIPPSVPGFPRDSRDSPRTGGGRPVQEWLNGCELHGWSPH
jgi:hypothetical protein